MDLSTSIRLLGDLLGEVIIAQESRQAFDAEERIRRYAKAYRAGEPLADQKLATEVTGASVDTARIVATAFCLYFDLVNLAEENNRVRGLRQQAQEDPWLKIGEDYPVGSEHEGHVARFQDGGVVVDMGNDLEGFVPESQLPIPEGKSPESVIKLGQEASLKVMEVDPIHHRIILAITELGEVPPQEEIKPELEVEAEADEAETEVADAGESTAADQAVDTAEAAEVQAEAAPTTDEQATVEPKDEAVAENEEEPAPEEDAPAADENVEAVPAAEEESPDKKSEAPSE